MSLCFVHIVVVNNNNNSLQTDLENVFGHFLVKKPSAL